MSVKKDKFYKVLSKTMSAAEAVSWGGASISMGSMVYDVLHPGANPRAEMLAGTSLAAAFVGLATWMSTGALYATCKTLDGAMWCARKTVNTIRRAKPPRIQKLMF